MGKFPGALGREPSSTYANQLGFAEGDCLAVGAAQCRCERDDREMMTQSGGSTGVGGGFDAAAGRGRKTEVTRLSEGD